MKNIIKKWINDNPLEALNSDNFEKKVNQLAKINNLEVVDFFLDYDIYSREVGTVATTTITLSNGNVIVVKHNEFGEVISC